MTQNSPHANSIPEEWLSAYLDEELTAEQRQLVDAAVKEQPHLAQLLEELIATRRLIQQLPVFPTTSRRLPSNSKSVLSDLDDGLDSQDATSNSMNLASASDLQLQQRLADDRPAIDLDQSDTSSPRLSWRMLALAASLIGVAALGTTLWYQSDRWTNLAFDTPSDNRVDGSAKIPEGLVDGDSGPKAFKGVENPAAPSADIGAEQGSDSLNMPRSMTEGGANAAFGGGSGSGASSGRFGGGLGGGLGGSEGLTPSGNAASGNFPTENLPIGEFSPGGMGGMGGKALSGNSLPTDPNHAFNFGPQVNPQLSHNESFNLLHEDAKALKAPASSARKSDDQGGRNQGGASVQAFPPGSLPMQSRSSGDDQFGSVDTPHNFNPSSPSIGTMTIEQGMDSRLPSASPSFPNPATSELSMELRGSPKQADASGVEPNVAGAIPINSPPEIASRTVPAAPARAAEVQAIDPAPVTDPKAVLEQPHKFGQSVEPLPPPAQSNARALQGMKAKDEAKDKAKGLPESDPARKAELSRGLDAANSALVGPSIPPANEVQSTETAQTDIARKSQQLKSPVKNQVLIPKSALYRSPAWSEAAVMAQLEGNPLYRPMLTLLNDANQDKSLKVKSDAKANQADESVLTAVVRLTANQRSAVIEQSKQLGIEPAIKDDGQTALVLFLSATEFDRLLESANQQEKLSIFWISPAKQSASSDRRVLIVNPY